MGRNGVKKKIGQGGTKRTVKIGVGRQQSIKRMQKGRIMVGGKGLV